ncbi:MAG: hypothetical protein NTY35_02155 [Planctomycetota bacterium]|nr:hypothetical protein [Planctomycetota bacterium]
MTNGTFLAAILALAALASCDHSSYSMVKTSSANGTTRTEAKMYGEGASLSVDGDALEIRAGELWFNGKSLGPIQSGQDVRFVVEGSLRELTVDGAVRSTVGK